MTERIENPATGVEAEIERMLAALAAADPPAAPPALLAAIAADAAAAARRRTGAAEPLLPRRFWAAAMAAGVAGLLMGVSGALDLAGTATMTSAATTADLQALDLLSDDATDFALALFGEEG